jgi:uncharacterized membrane protein
VPFLTLAHVLLAIVALGGSLTFPFWRRRAEASPEQLAFTVRTIRWIDRRVVIPAYLLLLATGLALAVGRGIALVTGWLAVSVALYAFALAIGFVVLGPAGRRQLALLGAGAMATPEYGRLSRRVSRAELIAVSCMATIAVLMILRPF